MLYQQNKRIHRSYIVAVSKVQWMQNRRLKLNHIELPVSDSYIEEVKNWISNIK